MITKDDELWYAVQDIVRKYTKQIYVTPYMSKQIIPAENIYPMKQELFSLVKSLQKGTNKDKM